MTCMEEIGNFQHILQESIRLHRIIRVFIVLVIRKIFGTTLGTGLLLTNQKEQGLLRSHILLRCKNKIDDQKGYKNKPLSQIPFYKYIIDTLHLFLRISDILSNLFFIEIQTSEYVRNGYPKKSPNIEKTTLVKRLRNFLKEKCRIHNYIYIDKNQNIKLKDLKGLEKLRLFKKLNISELFPEFMRATHEMTEFMKLLVDFLLFIQI